MAEKLLVSFVSLVSIGRPLPRGPRRIGVRAVVALALLAAVGLGTEARADRIFVAPIPGDDPEAAALSRSLETAVLKRVLDADVVTPRALDTQVEMELLKACRTGDDTSCVVDFAQSMGVDWVLRPQLGSVGDRAILTVSLYDGQRAALVGQGERHAPKDAPERLLEQVPDLVTEVAGAAGLRVVVPRPPAPPLVAWGAVGGGALLLVVSGATHVLAFAVFEPSYEKAEMTRDQARAWELARPAAYAAPVLGYLGGAALLGWGAWAFASEEP